MLLLQHFTKQCNKCKEIKTLDNFRASPRGINGVRSDCRKCNNLSRQQWGLNNKEHISKRNKDWYAKNIDIKSKYDKEYRKTESGKKSQRDGSKKYRQSENGKKNQAEGKKRYKKTLKGKISNKNYLHRRRINQKKGDVTNKELLELQQNSKVCYWCNEPLKNKKVHIDHYIPLSKGGEHTLSNLVVSCAKCNQTKNAKDPIEFAQSIGKLF